MGNKYEGMINGHTVLDKISTSWINTPLYVWLNHSKLKNHEQMPMVSRMMSSKINGSIIDIGSCYTELWCSIQCQGFILHCKGIFI